MVALNEDVIFGGPTLALGRAGVAIEGDFFLDELPVEVDGEEARLFEELAPGIEAGSAEFDDELLPLSGGIGGIDEGRVAFEAFRIPLVVPAVIDGSHVAIGGFFLAVAIEDLDLVTTLEIDAGVGAFWDDELGLDGAVSKLIDGLEVAGFSGVTGVREESGLVSLFDDEGFLLGLNGLGGLPIVEGAEDFLPGGGVCGEGEG